MKISTALETRFVSIRGIFGHAQGKLPCAKQSFSDFLFSSIIPLKIYFSKSIKIQQRSKICFMKTQNPDISSAFKKVCYDDHLE